MIDDTNTNSFNSSRVICCAGNVDYSCACVCVVKVHRIEVAIGATYLLTRHFSFVGSKLILSNVLTYHTLPILSAVPVSVCVCFVRSLNARNGKVCIIEADTFAKSLWSMKTLVIPFGFFFVGWCIRRCSTPCNANECKETGQKWTRKKRMRINEEICWKCVAWLM